MKSFWKLVMIKRKGRLNLRQAVFSINRLAFGSFFLAMDGIKNFLTMNRNILRRDYP